MSFNNLENLIHIQESLKEATEPLLDELGSGQILILKELAENCRQHLEEQIKEKLGQSLQDLTRKKAILCQVAIRFRRFFGAPNALLMTIPSKKISQPVVKLKDLSNDFLGKHGVYKKINKTLLVAFGKLNATRLDDEILLLDVSEDALQKKISDFGRAYEKNTGNTKFKILMSELNETEFIQNVDVLLYEVCKPREKIDDLRKRFFYDLYLRFPQKSTDSLEPQFSYFFQVMNQNFSKDATAFTFSYTQPLKGIELSLLRVAATYIANHLSLAIRNTISHRDEKEFEDIHGDYLIEKIKNIGSAEIISRAIHNELIDSFPYLRMATGDAQVSIEILNVVNNIAAQFGFPECKSLSENNYKPKNPLIKILYHAIDFEDKLKIVPGYRQHFIHSFNVFLLGYYLIHYKFNLLFGNYVHEDFKTYIVNKGDEGKKHLLLSWFITSIWHDVAYPLTNADKFTNALLRKMFVNPEETHKEDKKADKKIEFLPVNDIGKIMTIDKYAYASSQILYSQYHKINKDSGLDIQDDSSELDNTKWKMERTLNYLLLNREDHGIPSAIVTLNALLHIEKEAMFVMEKFNTAEHVAYKYAFDAIMWHDTLWYTVSDSYHCKKKINSLKRNPIANLLLICDMVQQWGRQSHDPIDFKFNVKLVTIRKPGADPDEDRDSIIIVLGYKYENDQRNEKKLLDLFTNYTTCLESNMNCSVRIVKLPTSDASGEPKKKITIVKF